MVRIARLTTLFLLLHGYLFSYTENDALYRSTSYIIDPAAVSDTSRHSKAQFYLLKLTNNVKKAELETSEFHIVRQVDKETFIVRANSGSINRKKTLFKDIATPDPLWKISPNLIKAEIKGKSQFIVILLENSQSQSLFKLQGIEVIKSNGNTFTVYGSLDNVLKSIIPIDDVIYVGRESVHPQTEARVLDLNLGPNTINRIHHSFPELNGEGMTISIKEEKYDPQDIDLQGRDVPSNLSSTVISNHATQMATIAAGAGNSFITGKGVAMASLLTSSDFQNLSPDNDANYAALQVSVQNHAYGTMIENFYGALAQSFDQSANRNPHLLHVFSSGNKGTETNTSGGYAGVTGFANLTGNFKMAKNILIVGSADTVGRAVALSSRGPAFDGRIKPELVAYSVAGTSNSAALVSGLALLLQQEYKEKKGVLPSSALIKSLLINSAADAGPPGIDFITGYGSVDGYRAMANLQQENYLTGTVNHQQTINLTIQVPANAMNLKVTLTWNDPAAPVNTNIALVNDLDMTLKSDLGSTWLPWVLDATADLTKLQQPATRNADHRNNVEQITVNNPSAGTYTITITGYDIPQGPQLFYISYQWDDSDEFEWSYPTGSDNMPYNGESGSYFIWKSTLSEVAGRLEYTIDDGATWNIIADQVNLPKGYFRWDAPNVTAAAKARMVAGSKTFITDRFTISRPPEITVGFNCTDSVMLQWNSIPGAERYELYTLNEKYLEPFLTSSDTAVILDKDELPSRLCAVQPMLAGNIKTIRSQSVDYEALNANCYLSSFITNVVPGEGIYLIAQLGTAYGVDKIFFERKYGNFFYTLGFSVPQGNTTVQFLDDQPAQGLNVYRARVLLKNGQEIISDTVENYYLTTLPFVVFPNPVKSSGELQIYSKQFTDQDIIFRLHRSDGVKVLEYGLRSDRESVPLNNVAAGFYFYTIESNEGFFKGKIIIH